MLCSNMKMIQYNKQRSIYFVCLFVFLGLYFVFKLKFKMSENTFWASFHVNIYKSSMCFKMFQNENFMICKGHNYLIYVL